jgi:hypothetical protein
MPTGRISWSIVDYSNRIAGLTIAIRATDGTRGALVEFWR